MTNNEKGIITHMDTMVITEFEIRNNVFKAFIENIPVYIIEKHINGAALSQYQRSIALEYLEDLVQWKEKVNSSISCYK